MKFDKSTRLALAIFLIYLTAFVELSQIESTLKLKLKSKAKNNIESKDFVATKHPLLNFLIGTLEGLGGNETGFYTCFPEEWKKPGNVNDGQTNNLDNAFKSWGPGLQTFLNAGETVVSFLCKFRESAMTLISGAVAVKAKKNRKFRMMSFMETRSLSGRRSKKLSAAYMRNYRAIMSVSEKKVQWFWDNLPEKAFKAWFQNIADKVNSLVLSVVDFFNGPIFKLIIKVFDCIQSAKKAINTIIKTIKDLKSKLDVLIKASANTVLLIITVVDYISAMICNWQKFKQAVDFFMGGWNNNNKDMKWLFYGKALGTLLYAISTSNTFDINKYMGIQLKISRRKK